MFAIDNFISYEVVQKIGWVLLHFVWQAAAVALVMAFALRVMRRFSANTIYRRVLCFNGYCSNAICDNAVY